MFKSSYIIQKTRSYPLTTRLEDFEEFFAYWRIFCLSSKRRNLQTIVRGRNPLHFPKRWQRSISMLPSIFKLLRTFCTLRSQSSQFHYGLALDRQKEDCYVRIYLPTRLVFLALHPWKIRQHIADTSHDWLTFLWYWLSISLIFFRSVDCSTWNKVQWRK